MGNEENPPVTVNPQQLQQDLTCGCDRAVPAARAVSAALAQAGNQCGSGVGQALAQAFSAAQASGGGQASAVSQALASAGASNAQQVSEFVLSRRHWPAALHKTGTATHCPARGSAHYLQKIQVLCCWFSQRLVPALRLASNLPTVPVPQPLGTLRLPASLCGSICGRLLLQQRPGRGCCLRLWRCAPHRVHQPPCRGNGRHSGHSLHLLDSLCSARFFSFERPVRGLPLPRPVLSLSQMWE